jgi:hypothetical protein
MQKEESMFLFTTGVLYYHDHHPEIFKDLESRLSPRWDQASLEARCYEIAHSIRNEYHNRRRSLKSQRMSYNQYPTLFESSNLEEESLIAQYNIVLEE